MALKGKDLVEVVDGFNNLTLTARQNESYRVKRITQYNTSAGAEDVDVTVDRKRLFQFVAPSGYNIVRSHPDGNIEGLTDFLFRNGLHPVIPVASGQEFTVSPPGANGFTEIVYDMFDGGDVRADEHNGSDASSYDFFQFISNSSTVTAGGDQPLDQSDLDSIFPGFPATDTVPANQQMQLMALFGTGVSSGASGTHAQHTDRIRMIQDRQDLFDQDLAGFLLVGDQDNTANRPELGTDAGRLDVAKDGQPHRIITFGNPLVFGGGSELNVFANVEEDNAGTADISAGDIVLGMWFRVRRMN